MTGGYARSLSRRFSRAVYPPSGVSFVNVSESQRGESMPAGRLSARSEKNRTSRNLYIYTCFAFVSSAAAR